MYVSATPLIIEKIQYNITVKNTVITFKKQSLLVLRAFKVLLFASVHISFLSKGVVSCDITRGQEVDLSFVMPNKCVAYGCSNSSKDDGISVFHFPKNEKKWIMQVSKTRDKWKGPTASSVVCSDHFTQKSFEDDLYQAFGIEKKRKLKPNAIPTIFKRSIISNDGSGLPSPKRRRMAYDKRKRQRVITYMLSVLYLLQ